MGDTEGPALFEAQAWGPLMCLVQHMAPWEPLVLAVSAPQGKGLSGGQTLRQQRLQKQYVDNPQVCSCCFTSSWNLG